MKVEEHFNPIEHHWEELEHSLHPDIFSWHQCLTSLMLLWLNEAQIPTPTLQKPVEILLRWLEVTSAKGGQNQERDIQQASDGP